MELVKQKRKSFFNLFLEKSSISEKLFDIFENKNIFFDISINDNFLKNKKNILLDLNYSYIITKDNNLNEISHNKLKS